MAEAVDYLKQLESAYRRATPDKQSFRMAAEGAIGALVAVGALDPRDAADWQARFTALVEEARTAAPAKPRRPQVSSARPTPTRLLGNELKRVVIPAQPAICGPIRVTSVELYSDGSVVRWIQAEVLSTALVVTEALRRCEISDDLGTAYSSLGGGAHGGGGDGGAHGPIALRGDVGFQPAVPDEVTQLTVTFGALGPIQIPIA